jgi:hypothetical protein
MSDKYDEAAREWWLRHFGEISARDKEWRLLSQLEMAEAFGWFAAKLAEERAKETCVIKRFPRPLAPPSFGQTKCQHSIETPLIDRYIFCPYCGRRIVEKVEK